MIKWTRYAANDRQQWDEFVRQARSRIFFFYRDFLEYHADRFTDYSLMCWEGDRLIAILPASRHGDQVSSHGGLTYGGLIIDQKMRASAIGDVLSELMPYLRSDGVKTLLYKSLPYIFFEYPSQEDIYFLFQRGATISRRDISSVIYLDKLRKLSKGRKWLIARAKKNGLVVEDSEDWQAFHSLLANALARHNASPVHSVDELLYLKAAFPQNISLRAINHAGEMIAASLFFKFESVVHTQYLATSEAGKELGALDLLIEEEIEAAAAEEYRYFSFGISTEDSGKILNEGLIAQKESFGARAITLDHYKVNIDD